MLKNEMRSKFIFHVLFVFLSTGILAQCSLGNYMGAFRIPPASFPYFSPGSGVTVSVSTNVTNYSNFTYNCGVNAYACSNPAWGLISNTNYIRLTFSAPVTNLTFIFNGTNQTEVFYFAAGTGVISLSNYCTPDYVATGSQLAYTNSPASGAIVTLTNPTGSTTYTVTHNGLGAGSRITLLDCFVAVIPLPIDLVDFNGGCIDKNKVKLDWKTAGEKNNASFTIERSTDSDHWQEAGMVAGEKNSAEQKNYTFVDQRANTDILYYRLKQTDLDGGYKFSEIITVTNCNENSDIINIYPNPATREFFVEGVNIQFLQLFNSLGEEVMNKKINEAEDLKIDLSHLPNGIYIVKVKEKNFKVFKE